jgi:hypothetical protein
MSIKRESFKGGDLSSFEELSIVDGKLQKAPTEAEKFQQNIQDNIPEEIIDELESTKKIESPKKSTKAKSAIDLAMEKTDSEIVVENEPVVKYKRSKSERRAPEDVDGRVGGLNQSRKAEQLVSAANAVEKPTPKKSTKLKSAVDLAMEKTDSIAQEYNEKKLKKEDISSATTLNELLAHIDASEGLQGSQEYFSKEQLRMIIEEVRDKKLDYDYITRSGGLRQKVFDLLENQPQAEEKPLENEVEVITEPESAIESEVVVEEEPVIEEVKVEEKLVKVKESVKPETVAKPEADDFDSIEARYAEEQIVESRKNMVQAHLDWEVLNKKANNPFRKFFLNGMGIGLEKHNEKLAGFEKIRLEYQKKIDELVELKSTVRFNEIAELHDNNPEKRKYSSVLYSDLMPYLKDKPQAVTDYLQELSKHDDISLSELRKIKAFKKEELQEIVNKVILKKIKDEVRRGISEKENELIDQLLGK